MRVEIITYCDYGTNKYVPGVKIKTIARKNIVLSLKESIELQYLLEIKNKEILDALDKENEQ